MNPDMIKRPRIVLCFLLGCLAALPQLTAGQDILSYVRPDIGATGCRWFFYTPAAVPGGMAKLAPSTDGHYGNASGWEAIGYDSRQHSIEGFVHFHEWQIGGVSFMPTTGPEKVVPGDTAVPGSGYRSHFDHAHEQAVPGYYSVLLDDYGIRVELTATRRVGFQRYVFPRSDQAHVVLDIGRKQGESGDVLDAGVEMVDATHFRGFVKTYPKYVKKYDPAGRIAMYFYGEISRKPESVDAFTSAGLTRNEAHATGKGAGLVLNYRTAENDTIVLKTGLSYTSMENARLNLEAEAANLSFDHARELAQSEWRRALGRITVAGKNDTDKIKFYTGLFHALLGRGVANDVNGDYPTHGAHRSRLPLDATGKPAFHFINTDAIWGGFWDLTQLWALAYPGWYRDFVGTQLQVYRDRGWFGDGLANSEFVSGVATNMVGLVVAAAYQTGIWREDPEGTYQAVRKNELGYEGRPPGAGKLDTRAFLRYGYSPFIERNTTDSTGAYFAASHTLEYCFSAFAAAQMAKALGKMADYRKLMGYSEGWKRLYNPANKLLQPKTADGAFIGHFDPLQPWRGYQEGNAVQYAFYVPQDPGALIGLVGRDSFNTRLNDIFDKSEKADFGGGKTIDAFAGINAVYNHGNEPSLHIAWLFNFSGEPWLTQKWTRLISQRFYGITPVHGYGYGQDEDQGQLGSWYVMTALGLFDVKGLTDARPVIELGSPLFDKATVRLGNGHTLEIIATHNGHDRYYVQSVVFNGRKLDRCWLYRDELMEGGKLVFTMGSRPNKAWGTHLPPP